VILAVDAFNLAADRRGMGRIVRLTLRALEELGAKVTLVARPRDRQALEPEFSNAIIEPRELRRFDHQAVWYPWNGMRFDPHAYSIVTVHDPFAFTFPHRSFIARRREQMPIRRALRRAGEIFAVSEWTAAQIHALFRIGDARMRVVPDTLDPFWRPDPSPGGSYMLFLAGPDERKNASMLFDAYDAAFVEGGPALIVAGNLRDQDERRFARMRAPHARTHPDDIELRRLYSGAIATLVPSLAEGFGLPALEAMACGSPVLAANAAALPETCAGAALLLPPQEPTAWRQALQRISADASLRDDLRARGFARVRGMDPQAPAKALLESVRRSRAAAR
jgi:glycosyltransferase involved in cell wall biosynthesis